MIVDYYYIVKICIGFLLFLITLFLILTFKVAKSQQIDTIKAKQIIGERNAIVIDIRKPDDYRQAHIDKAVNINLDQLDDFIEASDKSRPVICYCYKGISSMIACNRLSKANFKEVYSLKCGFDAWRSAKKN